MENPLVYVSALFAWVATLTFFRIYRIWLPFYVLGAVGLAAAIIHLGSVVVPLDVALQAYSALHVNLLANAIGIPTRIFDGAPGAILVPGTSPDVGLTVLNIDIECSGLVESAVLVGLLGFYPAWSVRGRLFFGIAGLVVTYLANLIRLLLIVSMLHWGGQEMLFVAHTVFGRGLFLAFVALTYWYLITRPTIRLIGRDLRPGMAR